MFTINQKKLWLINIKKKLLFYKTLGNVPIRIMGKKGKSSQQEKVYSLHETLPVI